MKKLLIYLKDYKIESVLAPLFKMLEALFELFVPIVMAKVIDIGIPAGDRSYVIRMCLVMILLGIIGLVCSITAQYFSAKAACGFAAKLRHSLFEHIQSLSFTEMDTIGGLVQTVPAQATVIILSFPSPSLTLTITTGRG